MNRKLTDVILYAVFTVASVLALVSSIITLIGSNGDSLASQILLVLVFLVFTFACASKLLKGILRLKAEGNEKTE